MKDCKKYEELTLEFLDGSLPEALHREMQEHLDKCPSCKKEIDAFRELQLTIERVDEQEPSITLRNNFELILREEENKNRQVVIIPKKHLRLAMQTAAALILFFTGMWMGERKDKQQVAALREEVALSRQVATVAMMQQPSASGRLKAVLAVDEMEEEPDFEIIAALGNRLEHDKQANVRLAAARALGKYGNQREVRDILLHALESQDDPSVQLAIIDVLVRWKEERAVNPLFELLQRDSLQSIVKLKAEQGIGVLM